MSFSLSARSKKNLEGVHPNLVHCAELAIQETTVDFAVICGMRTAEEQEAAFLRGASDRRTGGKHQIGLAIDVMALVGDLDGDGDSDENWEDTYYYEIARAFKHASTTLGVSMTWGLVWDRRLADLSDNLGQEAHDYFWVRKRGKGRQDGGHFELYFNSEQVVQA
jgi:peptidoglycan L-alanyl-D-glutamate endopeptidase CwlK